MTRMQQATVSTTPTTAPTSIPYNGNGTINIHVNNPMAGMPPMMPYYMPMMCYPPNYYLGNLHPNGINQITNINPNGIEVKGTGNTTPPQINKFDEKNSNQKADNNNKKEREVVVLTDNYIKNLENYLRNSNTELRKDAVKELLDRFKEDKSRINNPSLTALLNLALQDTNGAIRSVAMSILSAGYAQGDNNTEKILKNMQTTKDNYSLDASQAANSLLQMSKTKMKVADNSHYKTKAEKKEGVK